MLNIHVKMFIYGGKFKDYDMYWPSISNHGHPERSQMTGNFLM